MGFYNFIWCLLAVVDNDADIIDMLGLVYHQYTPQNCFLEEAGWQKLRYNTRCWQMPITVIAASTYAAHFKDMLGREYKEELLRYKDQARFRCGRAPSAT